jgi:hypothetical protein
MEIYSMADPLHHVGTKPLPLPDGVIGHAIFGGPKDCYRYLLSWRIEQVAQRTIIWLLMNPSVASESCADRTLLRCWRSTPANDAATW